MGANGDVGCVRSMRYIDPRWNALRQWFHISGPQRSAHESYAWSQWFGWWCTNAARQHEWRSNHSGSCCGGHRYSVSVAEHQWHTESGPHYGRFRHYVMDDGRLWYGEQRRTGNARHLRRERQPGDRYRNTDGNLEYAVGQSGMGRADDGCSLGTNFPVLGRCRSSQSHVRKPRRCPVVRSGGKSVDTPDIYQRRPHSISACIH